MEVMKAMPEFITRRDIEPRAWTVEEGAPVRGDAWTEMRVAKMRVPFGADETSRVVRAHELMHAKVSPISSEAMGEASVANSVSMESLISAEEFRVNMLVSNQGFDIDALCDGSESQTGKIIGQNKDWNSMVKFMSAIAGTKAGANFLRGLKTTSPEMEAEAREIQKAMNKYFRNAKKRGIPYIANTTLADNGLPRGFNDFTIPLARMIESLLKPASADGEPDEFGNDELPKVKNIAKGGSGFFARLIEKQVPKNHHIDGKLGRKRIATNIGRNPRRINRMLTDPEMRIFDRHAKGKGGVVLIDQSGSMSLSNEDIQNIIAQAPGCVIIGYSHRAGNDGTIPNVWVIADRGKVASEVPDGNGGNGVDGPAIRFAQAKRRNGEPFVWVCDGYVTDGTKDQYYQNLGDECATLVKRHQIHMVASVDEAVTALKRVAKGDKLQARAVGIIAETPVWQNAKQED